MCRRAHMGIYGPPRRGPASPRAIAPARGTGSVHAAPRAHPTGAQNQPKQQLTPPASRAVLAALPRPYGTGGAPPDYISNGNRTSTAMISPRGQPRCLANLYESRAPRYEGSRICGTPPARDARAAMLPHDGDGAHVCSRNVRNRTADNAEYATGGKRTITTVYAGARTSYLKASIFDSIWSRLYRRYGETADKCTT